MRNETTWRPVAAILVGFLLGGFSPSGAETDAEGLFQTQPGEVSRTQALALSVAFPGLGQMAVGHRQKGTALMVAEATGLVVWLTSHADYNTQSDQFDVEEERYLSLREGGSVDEAAESWGRLRSLRDDADASHTRRLLFGACAIGVYAYNLVDVFVLNGVEPAGGRIVALVPLTAIGQTGVALVARF